VNVKKPCNKSPAMYGQGVYLCASDGRGCCWALNEKNRWAICKNGREKNRAEHADAMFKGY
jgi:hypothetical protein